MKLLLWVFTLIAATSVAANDKPDPIEARGTIHFIFDSATETTFDGVLFARFVPDDQSAKRFRAVTSGPHPGAVSYISLEPAEIILKMTVGNEEAARLSKGQTREVAVPVMVQLDQYNATVECDARAYYANLVSVKALGPTKVAELSKASYGC